MKGIVMACASAGQMPPPNWTEEDESQPTISLSNRPSGSASQLPSSLLTSSLHTLPISPPSQNPRSQSNRTRPWSPPRHRSSNPCLPTLRECPSPSPAPIPFRKQRRERRALRSICQSCSGQSLRMESRQTR